MSLNILIVSQYFWPENFRINELSYELKRSGNNVTVLTGYPNYPNGEIYESFKQKPEIFRNYKGIEIIRVPVIPRGKKKVQLFANYLSFTLSASIIGAIKLLKYKFDTVFVFQTSPVFVGIPSSIISFIKKSPQIIWVLDLWPETLEAIGIIKKKWQLEFIRFFVNIIYSRCNIILTQSKSFIKKIKKYQDKKIIYFPAWAESAVKNASKKLAKEISLKKNILTLVFTGNVGEAQDFLSVLKAADYLISKKFHKFRIIIIGEGSKKDWLIKEVSRKNLKKHFEFLNQYPLDRMPSFFAHADSLLVSLAKKDIFKMTIPGKIQTYLSSGVPIIGMLDGEGQEVIRKSNSGYVCGAGDYRELGNLIIKMSKLKKVERKKLGLNGIEFCNKEFNKDNLLIKLQKILIDMQI